jgi:hypothetical protein
LAGIAGVAQMVFALVAMWRLPPEELGPRTGIPARWHFAIGGLLIANATLLVIGMSDSALILAPIFLLAGGVTDILGVVEWRRIDSDVASEEQAE